jgi:preprotein translocase subunit SecG
MLSFMREQGPGQLPAQQSENGADTPEKAEADSAHKPQEQEYLTVKTQDKDVRRSTMLLAVLFGIGLLCLWFMIKKSSPKTVSAAAASNEEVQIEMAIAKLTGVRSEMFDRMDQIVQKFYEFSDVRQVKVNELAKNPFKHEIFMGSLNGTSDTQKEDDAELRQQLLSQQANDIQLLSIMQSGQRSCCMIDDKILYEGDSIRGFEVIRISDSFVKLESEGMQLLLKLSE